MKVFSTKLHQFASFLPQKFPTIRYLAITEDRLKVDVCVHYNLENSAAMSKHVPVKAIWF